jgi:EAL domain-containing protein (putative c-di-GMP-specific phosphodiesterase class I)
LLAIAENQFQLHYQAQVGSEGQLKGAEALIRWNHPQRGLVPPVEFVPFAEETGLILPLGQWVLETACNQLVAWAAHPETADLTLAVNVSSRQFQQPSNLTSWNKSLQYCTTLAPIQHDWIWS